MSGSHKGNDRRTAKVSAVCPFILVVLCGLLYQETPIQTQAQIQTVGSSQPKRIVIAADRVLDGRGRELRNVRIVIEGSKIILLTYFSSHETLSG